jgi:hypothetical protein
LVSYQATILDKETIMNKFIKTILLLTFLSAFVMGCSNGAIIPLIDTSSPSWNSATGIVSAIPDDSQVTINWGTASDSQTSPVFYLLYMDTDDNLWDQTPIEISNNSPYVFTGLTNGTEYWFGVRCRDSAVNPNVDGNTVVLSAKPYVGSAISNPQHIATAHAFSDIREFAVQGDYAYATTGTPEFYIIDLTDPSNPQAAGTLDLPSSARFVDIQGDYAFTSHGTFSVIDVSDPMNPVLVSSIDAHSMIIESQGDYVYVIYGENEEEGLRIIDISDPANPSVTPKDNNYIEDFTVYGGYAYVFTHVYNMVPITEKNTIHVIDISNPSNPVEIASVELDSQGIMDPIVHNGYLYFTIEYKNGDTGMEIFNISDPTNLVSVRLLNIGTDESRLDIFQDHAFLLCDENLSIVDISDPLNPSISCTVPNSGSNCVGVKAYENHLYIHYPPEGFFCYELN